MGALVWLGPAVSETVDEKKRLLMSMIFMRSMERFCSSDPYASMLPPPPPANGWFDRTYAANSSRR